jgi:hypothetical protein
MEMALPVLKSSMFPLECDSSFFADPNPDFSPHGKKDDSVIGGADILVCQNCRFFLADKNVCPTVVRNAD